MPYLTLTLSGPPSRMLATDIAACVTDLTVETLGKKRELTVVTIGWVEEDLWFIGGKTLERDSRSFQLDVKITEGTNTKDEKARYIAQVFDAVQRLAGPLHPASYVVIHEVRGDAWGYEGRTQEFRYIARAAL
jgi:4-oxalocrotonate tautomerase